ncbi:MAG: hypothetical protein NZL90_01385 [Aquificaceae bacterium]|nr:hypothetical protein [Aquificaceae bacterium]MDW8236874.1 hypothetical protein [Aquificaceae bacterium]
MPEWVVAFVLFYFAFGFLYPAGFFLARRAVFHPLKVPNVYLYSFVIHIHSQFSYDSLGKPEDIERAMRQEDIDFAIVTDHDVEYISAFVSSKVYAGVEKKLHDNSGVLIGSLLKAGPLKVVAHPFRGRWKELPDGAFVEIVDLKDALKERLSLLLFLLPFLLSVLIFSRELFRNTLLRLIDLRGLVRRYQSLGFNARLIGGLDHHVKVYIREVGIRFLFPNYRDSFAMLKNVAVCKDKVSSASELLEAIKDGASVGIVFGKELPLWWVEDGFIKLLTPRHCLLEVRHPEGVEHIEGSFFELGHKECMLLGYTYKVRFWRFYFGLMPMFLIECTASREGR